MFCLYTFPLARPAQTKIQYLTAICCIVKLIPWNVPNLSQLYKINWYLAKKISTLNPLIKNLTTHTTITNKIVIVLWMLFCLKIPQQKFRKHRVLWRLPNLWLAKKLWLLVQPINGIIYISLSLDLKYCVIWIPEGEEKKEKHAVNWNHHY